MRKFVLPENANTDKISAVCQDGVLTVTVEKLPPPEPKKPKTVEEALFGFDFGSMAAGDVVMNSSAIPLGPTLARLRLGPRHRCSGRDARGRLRDTGGCQGVPELLHLHCRHAGDEARRHQGSGGGRQCAGDQRREEARGGEGRRKYYVRMEGRMGKFMRKFALQGMRNSSDRCEMSGWVLTVTVQKLPPPGPRKPKITEVNMA
ncbi:17.2 kDa class II heat shock protein [Vitis vinifera]|uniref:17.2 kDa class II heat shock protein n=1 Tax=Vitis vinifera TaxID=29760 RepID=A0A438EXH8_VITVI|nr:17.2 kDa class II heat shock protein [Vitis vinifera]